MRLSVSRNRLFRRFLKNQTGAVAVEYAVLGVGIALAIIGGITVLGPEIRDLMLVVLPGLL